MNGDAANPEAEAERGYWKRLERVDVELIKEKEGWFLQKYKVTSDVSESYSAPWPGLGIIADEDRNEVARLYLDDILTLCGY